MSDMPLCPSCGRAMTFSRTLDPAKGDVEDVNVYKCTHCNVSFVTEDSLPIAGTIVH